MGNAGRVLMIPKGEYNSTTTYEMLDFVYYQGRSYVCKQTSTGNAPTNTTYWQALTGDASAEIQALTNYVADTGVKNLLPITAENATSDTLQFTVNKNSSGSVTSITWSGKREGSGRFFKQLADAFILPAGSYILSGGYNSYASVLITGISAEDTGSGATFVSDGVTAITPYAVVYNGRDYNGETIYPMIRSASIADATYQPYAKTNVELTQGLNTSVLIENVIDTTDASGVSDVVATLEKLAGSKTGILYITFITTQDAPSAGSVLGVLKASCTRANPSIRAVVPLVNDYDGSVEGSLYLNTSPTTIKIYKVTSGRRYYCIIPVILA